MKNLLENEFTDQYEMTGKKHPVSFSTVVGNVSCCDEISCKQCIPFFYSNCGHETFLLYSESELMILKIEEFINSFKKLSGNRCDLMLYDNQKVVLLDMYCGMSNYVDSHYTDGELVKGKRAKVREQITATIDLLYSVSAIAAHLDGIEEKQGIFGCRLKDEEMFLNIPKVVKSSAEAFMATAMAMRKRKISTPLSHNFSYRMVQYPTRYEW